MRQVFTLTSDKLSVILFRRWPHKITTVKVVDSCWISSTEWSDTFRSFFVYGKEQESLKKIYHNRAKKFHLPKDV